MTAEKPETALSRLRELARRAEYGPAFSDFLDPAQARLAVRAAGECGAQILMEGGHPDAERRVACFFADEPPVDWPIACIRMRWNVRYGSPRHRDLLGALLGLGISRGKVGDVALDDGAAYAFVAAELAPFAAGLESAGRVALRVDRVAHAPALPPPEGRVARDTLPSLRLDALVAAGFSLSRAEAQRLIASGAVKLNHAPQLRPDAPVDEGDLISARGQGRARLIEVEGLTKKERYGVKIFRYGGEK
ncbi:MAG: RNA-binding protein [Clostridiales bacterium]|nr:RNA-binding protein [Clostridiales bacterium]